MATSSPPGGTATDVPKRSGAAGVGARVAWGIGVFVLALAWNRTIASGTTPIGASEEHFALGQRLYRTGSLADGTDPGLLRPPGYPAFVAATLHARDVLAGAWGSGEPAIADEDAVLFAQHIVVAATSAVIFAFAATVVPPLEAACAGLVFSAGPIALALVGLRSYQALHLLALALATTQLALAARAPGARAGTVFLSGVGWGLATLVRPVSLILPPFVFLLGRFRRGGHWRAAARLALLVTAGMALAILPYSVRNYRAVGRPVPVNLQSGFHLWGATAVRPAVEEDSMAWLELWNRYGMTLYRQVTGRPDYDLGAMSSHVVEMERVFRRQALANIRRQPSVYLRNVADNVWRFCSDSMVSWPTTFADQNLVPRPRTGLLVGAYSLVLLLLGMPGVLRGVWRRDAAASALLLVFASLVAAHAVGFYYGRYGYVKLPLLVMALPVTLSSLEGRSVALWNPRLRVRLAAVIAVGAAAGSAGATWLLLAG